jgi:hypothetical protein
MNSGSKVNADSGYSGGFAALGFGEPVERESFEDRLRGAEMHGWSLEMMVEHEALKMMVPFRSSDVASALGMTHQRATYVLGILGWPSSNTALLKDGKRGTRWLPMVIDRRVVDDREVVNSWDELHEDDQRRLWEEHG